MKLPEKGKGFGQVSEVTAFFEGKTLKPTFSWLDVWGEEHAHAFMVAGAVELELLTAFRDTIATALQKGQGFEAWQKDMRAELKRLGWHGPRMISDPTGKEPDRMVDFSSTRRLKTIFSSNMNSARAAGQWQRAHRGPIVQPYFLYMRSPAKEPREEHLGWAGLILPIDHPFWKTHFPPNGWGCLCQVMAINKFRAEKLLAQKYGPDGIHYRSEVPDDGPPKIHRNRRTGVETEVPRGIDPGWHTNPGLTRSTTLLKNLDNQLERAHPKDATAVIEKMWKDPFLIVGAKLPGNKLPVGHAAGLAKSLPGVVSPVVSMSSELIADHIGRGVVMDDIARLPKIIEKGRLVPPKDEAGKALVRQLLARYGRRIWQATLRLVGGRLEVGDLSLTKDHSLDDLIDLDK